MSDTSPSPDVSPETVEGAYEEMEYTYSENQFGRTTSASIPCQLRFTEPPTQDTDQFHTALEEHGFDPLAANPDRKSTDERAYYDGELCENSEYKRFRVNVNRHRIRLFPREEMITKEELENVLNALQCGFNAPLTHDPINNDS